MNVGRGERRRGKVHHETMIITDTGKVRLKQRMPRHVFHDVRMGFVDGTRLGSVTQRQSGGEDEEEHTVPVLSPMNQWQIV